MKNDKIRVGLIGANPERGWAMGDCAAVPDANTGRPQPPTAQHALPNAKPGTQRRTSRRFSPAIRRSRSASPPLASSRRSATGTASRTSSA